MTWKAAALVSLSLIGCAGASYPQSFQREAREARARFYLSNPKRLVIAEVAQQSSVLSVRVGGLSATPVTAALPFDLVGSLEPLTGGFLLASGLKAGTPPRGVIALVRVQDGETPSVTVERTAEYADGDPAVSFDPYTVAYNPLSQDLWVLDCRNRRIMRAVWLFEGYAIDLPALSAFAVAYDSVSMPLLGGARFDIGMWSARGGEQAGVYISEAESLGLMASFRVFRAGDSYVLDSTLTKPDPCWTTNTNLENARGPLTILGGPGPFTIRNIETGEQVAAGKVTDPEVGAVVTLPAPGIPPGYCYEVAGPGVVSMYVVPLVRYGVPLTAPELEVRAGTLHPLEFFVGAQNAVVGTYLQLSEPPPEEQTVPLNASLWVGLRSPETGDPVEWLGPHAYLSWVVAIVDSVATIAGARNVGGGQSHGGGFAIPDDPALAGQVLLFQWVVVAPNGHDVALSDVFGVTVRGSRSPAKTGGKLELERPSKESFQQAVRAITGNSEGLLDPRKLDAYVATRRRILTQWRAKK